MRKTWIYCAIFVRVLAASSTVIRASTSAGALFGYFATFSSMLICGIGGGVQNCSTKFLMFCLSTFVAAAS